MFTVEVNKQNLNARMTAMPEKVRAALQKRIYSLAIQLANLVRQKLSGQVLQVRSGDLRGSIDDDVTSTSTSVSARVFSSGDVKYAGIHEFGGVIPAHEVVPDKAKALAFVWQGKQVFFRRVQIPDVNMPERSYLRSSLSDMKQQIIDGIAAGAREGLR